MRLLPRTLTLLGLVSLARVVAACDGADSSNPATAKGQGGGVASGGGAGAGTPGATSGGGNGTNSAGSGAAGGGAAGGGTPGYFHTQGGHIVDAAGNVVRLTGLSWFGLETSNFAPHGLWARSMDSLLDQVKALGYNTLRVPYTNQMFDDASQPNGVDFGKNPELMNLKPLDILDKLVEGAGARGLRVVLDRHRPEASGQSELWYTGQTPETRWISDWTMLAQHYLGNTTVIGFDLHNEPHGSATWGDGNMTTDWRLAAERGGNAVLAVNPDLLIIVEGIEHVGSDYYWWGGNLSAAGNALVDLEVPNRVVYSPHDYPSSVYGQSWFSDASYPNNLHDVWESHWGYLASQQSAPIWIGEFGSKLETTSDQQWLTTLANYIQSGGLSFAFWCLNPDSGDTGGILQDDWQTVNTNKQSILQPLLAPPL